MLSLKDYGQYVGKKVGQWNILELIHTGNRYMYKCKCECGNEGLVKPGNIIRQTSMCCRKCSVKKTLIHKKNGHCMITDPDFKLYRKWRAMHQRCYNPKCKCFKEYGGRGIKICDEWFHNPDPIINEEHFQNFAKWARTANYNDDLTIDRIDVDKNYAPDNCRWLTETAQASNRQATKNSKTGYAGVTKLKTGYKVSLSYKNNLTVIGSYPTLKEAVEARNQYIKDHNLPHLIQEYKEGE